MCIQLVSVPHNLNNKGRGGGEGIINNQNGFSVFKIDKNNGTEAKSKIKSWLVDRRAVYVPRMVQIPLRVWNSAKMDKKTLWIIIEKLTEKSILFKNYYVAIGAPSSRNNWRCRRRPFHIPVPSFLRAYIVLKKREKKTDDAVIIMRPRSRIVYVCNVNTRKSTFEQWTRSKKKSKQKLSREFKQVSVLCFSVLAYTRRVRFWKEGG